MRILDDNKDTEYGSMMSVLYTSPIEATLPVPNTDTKYIHARFALMDENVTGIVSGFYSLIVNYLKYIADNYALRKRRLRKRCRRRLRGP